MLRGLFENMPDVVKNLLILNVLFFLATFVFEARGVPLTRILGLHYPSSQFFEPYQIATHFFMHGGIFHLVFNMFGLVILGSHLERVWGPKRFLLFYFITALGAAFLYLVVEGIEIYNLTGQFFPNIEILDIDLREGYIEYEPGLEGYGATAVRYVTPVVGASGAIYGLLMAFAMLFPNTQFMLLFPPIPIKAKWLALILGALALYSGFQRSPGDSVAHFAHLGGMLFGFILIKIWKKDNSRFY